MSDTDEIVALDDDDDEIDERRHEKSDSEDDSDGNGSDDSDDDDDLDEEEEDERDDRYLGEESDEMEVEDDILIDSDSMPEKSTNKQVNGRGISKEKDGSQASSQESTETVGPPDHTAQNSDPLELMEIVLDKTIEETGPTQTESSSAKALPPKCDPNEIITEAEKVMESFRYKRPRPVSPELPPSPIPVAVEDTQPKNILEAAKFDVR